MWDSESRESLRAVDKPWQASERCLSGGEDLQRHRRMGEQPMHRRRSQAGLRPMENITGGGALPWSDEPAPQCNLSAERHSRGAGPSGRPPTTSAACALATGATRDLRARSPPTPVGSEGGSPVPVPCRASPGPPDCQCARCAPGLTPSPRRTARFRITGRFLCVIVTRRCRVVPREQELLR